MLWARNSTTFASWTSSATRLDVSDNPVGGTAASSVAARAASARPSPTRPEGECDERGADHYGPGQSCRRGHPPGCGPDGARRSARLGSTEIVTAPKPTNNTTGKATDRPRRLHGDEDQQSERAQEREPGIQAIGVIVGMKKDGRQHRDHADQQRRQEDDPLGRAQREGETGENRASRPAAVPRAQSTSRRSALRRSSNPATTSRVTPA